MDQLPPAQAVTELLGVMAYTHLTTFTRLAADAEMAPDLHLKTVLARFAVAEFERYDLTVAMLEHRGGDVEQAMAPFVPVLDAYHRHTEPGDWLEGLIKAYVGDGLTADLHRELTLHVDPAARQEIVPTLDHKREDEVFVATLRRVLAENPARAGQLTLYARRILGEAMSRARTALTGHSALSALMAGGEGVDGVQVALTRLGEAHERRMAALGLT